MNLTFNWQEIQFEGDVFMSSNIQIQKCTKQLIIGKVSNICIVLDPNFKAKIYPKKDYQGNFVILFSGCNQLLLESIGSIQLIQKSDIELSLVAEVYRTINNKKYTIKLPPGLYENMYTYNLANRSTNEQELTVSVKILDPKYQTEDFNNGFQIVETTMTPKVQIVFQNHVYKQMNIYDADYRYNEIKLNHPFNIKILDNAYKVTINPDSNYYDKPDKLVILETVEHIQPFGVLNTLSLQRKTIADFIILFFGLKIIKNNEMVILFVIIAILISLAVFKILN